MPTAQDIVAELSLCSATQLEELVMRYADDPRTTVQRALRAAQRRCETQQAEQRRLKSLYELQRSLVDPNCLFAIGVDEVGRGPLAGPLTVGCVCLGHDVIIEGLNDSKKLTAEKRQRLSEEICQRAHVAVVYSVSPQRIDGMGMAAALREAMVSSVAAALEELAQKDSLVSGLSKSHETSERLIELIDRPYPCIDEHLIPSPSCILIDGNTHFGIPQAQHRVKGDSSVAAIAAASIVAKCYRDAHMIEMDTIYPQYGFASHKGYGSEAHIAAIKRFGLSELHRKSFCTNIHEQLSLL